MRAPSIGRRGKLSVKTRKRASLALTECLKEESRSEILVISLSKLISRTFTGERLFVTFKNTSQILTIKIQKTVIKWSQLFAKTRMNIVGVFIFANSSVGLAKLRTPKTSSTSTILTHRWVLKYTRKFRK